MLRLVYNLTAMFSLSIHVLFSIGCGNTQQLEQPSTDETLQTQPAVESSVPELQQPSEVLQSKDDMKVMVTLSIEHHTKQGKGPADWDSFIKWAKSNNPDSGETLKRLREAGVVFYCEQDAKKATAGQSNSIFAYYPSVPVKGGIVALMIGSVVEMSAEDFIKMLEIQTKFDPDNVAKKSN